MSEAITKASPLCSVCKGVGEVDSAYGGTLKCTFCPPGGRFSDVEATLRAKITELSREAEDLRMSAEAWRDKYVAARREIERLKGREAAAAKVMQAHLDGDATNRMCAAWLARCES